jgi:GT2 family glycosyltransferase
MKVSVIVVNYNTKELLERCLRSVYAGASSFEIIVADNHSSDGSADCVREQFPRVTVIENETNLGFSRANNAAALASRGEIIAFLNSDTEIRNGALNELAAYLDGHGDVGIAGPRVVFPDGRFQPSAGALPGLMQEFKDRRLSRRLNAGDEKLRARIEHGFIGPREVGWVTGSCLLIRRSLFMELGGFDETLFMYFEDKDLCRRARDLKWKVMAVPRAEIVHVLGGSSSEKGGKLRKVYRKSQRQYYRKHLGWVENLGLRLYQALSK